MRLNTFILTLPLTLASAQQSLVDYLQSQPDLSHLTSIVPKLPEIAQFLGEATNLTIFLPTNDAIAALPPDSWEGKIWATENIEGIAAILSLHVISGIYTSKDFGEEPKFIKSILTGIEPIAGESVANVTGGQNVEIVLDGSDATVISGYLSKSKVIEADISAGNNLMLHKIDKSLRLPVNVSTTATKLNLIAAAHALDATGLTETVDTVPDLTIFIPNDEAFRAVMSELASAIQKPGGLETAKGILSYHAIAGSVLFSTDLSNGMSVESLVPGKNLTITVGMDGSVFVDKAKVVVPNVILGNGVAHVIDSILMPSASGAMAGTMTGGSCGSNFANATMPNATMPNATFTPMPYTGEAAGQLANLAATAGVFLMAVVLAL